MALLRQISTFKTKVVGSVGIPPEAVLKECVRACVTSTYDYIFNNCISLYQRQHGEDQKVFNHLLSGSNLETIKLFPVIPVNKLTFRMLIPKKTRVPT